MHLTASAHFLSYHKNFLTTNTTLMLRYTKSCSHLWVALNPCGNSKQRKHGISIFFVSILLMLSSQAISQSPSADLDQGENGSASSPKTIFWQNGNLGPSGAHFAEGYSIPYRMRISGLVGNATTIHTLIIEWDTKDQNGHALDYITHYYNLDNPEGSHQKNYTHGPEAVDPTTGTGFVLTDSLEYQIPTPSSTGAEKTGQPANSFNDLPGSTRANRSNATKMAIWGGTIVDFLYLKEDNQDATTASTKTQLRIRFRSNNGSTALIAWGGHIAAEYDWGLGRGASKVSGSPYHMRLISIDGKGGNQDRSLKASAVLVPTQGCTLSAAQTACEGTTAGLTYSYTGSTAGITNYAWTLTPSTTHATIQNGTTTTTLSGANVTSITIVPGSGQTFATGTFTVSLTVTNLGGAGTPCTQTGTINQAATANANIDQTICEGSTVQLAGSVGGGASSGTWSTSGDGTFSPNATTLNAVYTPGTQDKASSSAITLTLTTNDPTGPCGAVSDFMLLTINDPATADAGDDQTVCASSPTVTLDGSVGGGASSGSWSGGNGTFLPNANALNATYTPTAAEVLAGSVTLTLTTNDPTGPCGTANDAVKINYTANPTRPAVDYIAPECNEETFSVRIKNVVDGGSYALIQNYMGAPTITRTTAANKDADGNIVISGLVVGKGFSIVLTVGDCSSLATDCSNYKTSGAAPLTQEATTNIQSVETVTARIDPKQSKVLAAPNPFNSKIRFALQSAVSGHGSLELYNMLGQKVKTVYQGFVKEGQTLNVEYAVPMAQRTNLVYVFRVGDQQVTGKLVSIK